MLSNDERELLSIIKNSADPEKVAEYALNLFLDYLRAHGSAQDGSSERPRATS